MKLKAFITLVVMAIIMTLFASAVNAEDPTEDYWVLFNQDRICFLDSEDKVHPVAVIDTFEIVDSWDVVNVGSTSAHFFPCVATACPDGMVLLSGNVCVGEAESPFAHIPVLTDEEYQEQQEELVAVGEPPIPPEEFPEVEIPQPRFVESHGSLSGWMNGTMYFGGQL